MNTALRSRFPPFENEASLRSAIESVCADFGKVTYLRILRANPRPTHQFACFLRLDSAAAESKLMLKFHVFGFGSEIAFLADVDERCAGPAM